MNSIHWTISNWNNSLLLFSSLILKTDLDKRLISGLRSPRIIENGKRQKNMDRQSYDSWLLPKLYSQFGSAPPSQINK